MILIGLLTGAAGYLFNEELLWQRICRNLDYAHLGWLFLRNTQALLFFAVGCVGAIVKAFMLSKALNFLVPDYYALAVLCYLGGNILAAKQSRGLYYTPWLVLWGLGLAVNPALFRIPCTVLCTSWILSRRFSYAVTLAIFAGLIAVCVYAKGYQLLLLICSIFLTFFFSGRLAPFQTLVIRYRGKQS
ncbi:MAG: hypothetical protein WAO24_10240 [Peptococcia bacterium]